VNCAVTVAGGGLPRTASSPAQLNSEARSSTSEQEPRTENGAGAIHPVMSSGSHAPTFTPQLWNAKGECAEALIECGVNPSLATGVPR
jgi:hypothetical protein